MWWRGIRKLPQLADWRKVSGPVWLVLGVVIHRILVSFLGMPLLHRHYYFMTARVVFIIGLGWLALARSFPRHGSPARSRHCARHTGTGSLVLLGQRVAKALVVIAAGLAVLGVLGFNLTTALAGLGIGGLAIGFGAQKTIENLFGGISLLGDEVIRVGDTCNFNGRVGTIEDISLRSTRIRTVERTELSIPNGALATMNIENLSRRDKFLFNPNLGLAARDHARPVALCAKRGAPDAVSASESRDRQRPHSPRWTRTRLASARSVQLRPDTRWSRVHRNPGRHPVAVDEHR